MEADRAARAHAIFNAALDTPPELRNAAVTTACAGDTKLEARVRRLLNASDQNGNFLESPAIAQMSSISSSVPDAVGNYLVVRVLGVGGMATVYEAVQENPNRRVALKVMHQSMSHTDAYLRFRLECETLARLHHPGIAQIYEAGTAQLGQATPSPFFAMELVEDASSITEYSNRHALPLRQRLLMFASVCDAVLHGHQNGIIHRDIKPGNVLVGASPDGVAKVIDFGIARTIESAGRGVAEGAPSITSDSDARRLIGTLNYMSPEQCNDPGGIDVRTDVYSLGVMLYELVTGQLPHDFSKCSIPEAVRTIAQDSPPAASTKCRQAAGDLDAIIAKAMDKDRSLRYSGAGALAADVRRWLDGISVDARRASALERAYKFARRNRPLAATTGLLALTLLVGAAVAGRLAYVATKARDEALQRERELEIVTEFQESLLRSIDVAAMGDRLRASLKESIQQAARKQLEESPTAEDLSEEFLVLDQLNFTSLAVRSLNESVLQRYAASIKSQFADQPVLRARLLQQLASTMNTLGLHNDAEPVITEALNIRRATLGDDHADTLQSCHSLGSLLTTLGRYDDAIGYLREAQERSAHVIGQDDPATLRYASSLAGAYRRRGDLALAEQLWTDTLRAERRVLGDDDPETLRTLNNLGVVYAAQNKMEKAETCWREFVERRLRVFGEDSPEYRGSLGNLGVLLQDQGRFAEARPRIEQALAADRRRFGDTHSRTLVAMSQLASLLQESGDLAGAESLMRECLQGRTKTLGEEHPDSLSTKASLASIVYLRGERTLGKNMITETLETQRRLLGNDHLDTIESQKILTDMSEGASAPSDSGPEQP